MLVTAPRPHGKAGQGRKKAKTTWWRQSRSPISTPMASSELASKNFIRVIYHSLADKPEEKKKGLLKRLLKRS